MILHDSHLKVSDLLQAFEESPNWALLQGRNEEVKGTQLPGRLIIPGGAEKSQQCHKHFLQYSTDTSERSQIRTWGRQTIATPKTYKSNFIHHDFVQFGKQHSRYTAIFSVHCFVTVSWSILHPSYSSEAVMRLDYQKLLKSSPLTLLAGTAPGRRRINLHILNSTSRSLSRSSQNSLLVCFRKINVELLRSNQFFQNSRGPWLQKVFPLVIYTNESLSPSKAANKSGELRYRTWECMDGKPQKQMGSSRSVNRNVGRGG